MKKAFKLYFVGLAAMLGFVACDDSESEIVSPSLSVSLVEVSYNSATFEVQAENMTSVYYMFQTGDQEVPSVAEVFSKGTLMVNTQGTLNGLESGASYRVVAAGRNEDLGVELMDTLNFVTPTVFETIDDEFTAEYPDVWWYGRYSDGVDQFFVQLSTAKVEPVNARPQEGGKLVRFYVFAPATTAENPQLAPGTYTLGGDTNEEGTFWRDGSVCAVGTTADDWMQVGFKSGELTIGYENGLYIFSADLVLNDGHDTPVKAYYQGEVKVENLSDGFRHFYDDVEHQVMNGAGGYVATSSGGTLDCYTISFYNTPVDEYGFVAGEGYVAQLSLYTDALPYGEFDFAGDYSVNADWEENGFFADTFISGFVYDMYGIKVPQGTCISLYNSELSIAMAGLAADGTVSVESKDGGYVVTADLTTSTGAHVSFNYEGEIALEDYRTMPESSLPAASSLLPKAKAKKTVPMVSGWHKFE